MCAIFGFVNCGKKISYKKLKNLVKELSIACEFRGTDATGISYVKDNQIKVFKKPKPAHQLNLYFPKTTTTLIGHTKNIGVDNSVFKENPLNPKETLYFLTYIGILQNQNNYNH